MAKLNEGGFLDSGGDYRNLIFYKKTKILFDMTYWFKEHYLEHGDRTQDQMQQAARSGKQNIAEGKEDGLTSAEMELKLVNVARSSLTELREDYEDQLMVRRLKQWEKNHPRFCAMKNYCYRHHEPADYQKYYEKWSIEELCNVALTLIHQADKGMWNWIKKREQQFLEEGGIREKMSAARREARDNNKNHRTLEP